MDPTPRTGWVLEGFLEGSQGMVVTPISTFPFRIGRRAQTGLRLPGVGVSSVHAELDHDGERLWVRDLNSLNGTYVNRRRVSGQQAVKEGDILHFATSEFVLRLLRDEESDEQTVHRTMDDLPHRAGPLESIARLLRDRAVEAHFQPIVQLEGAREVMGWEALGRGRMDGLPASPVILLERAARCDRAVDLSVLFREVAVESATALGPRPTLFLNCHPDELGKAGILARIQELRLLSPDIDMVLEIHEKAVADVSSLRDLVAALGEMGVRTAFDDFGSGQARLLELVDATPAFVKFDKALTRGLHDVRSPRGKMVAALVQMVRGFGIVPVAEGIETEPQAAGCLEIGFQLGQGFLFGKPEPATGRRPT